MLLPESLRFADRDRFHYRVGYFLPWKHAMVPALQAEGVEVVCFGARNNLQMLWRARAVSAFLRQQRIDVLHCHLPLAGAVGRIAGRLAGVPVVYSEHNKQERYHGITRKLNALTWGWQSRAIAVSADVAESIRTNIGERVPVDVVLNGVDVDRFHRAAIDPSPVRARFGIPPGASVVGSVAVFRTQKRLDHWITAARLLREREPGVRFLLVGDGPLRAEVTAAIAAGGLTDVVHLPGLQEDVRPYLAAIDVYMMSSQFEGLPVALLEAMAMECAVVCTAVGGIPELVRPGENGLLVAPDDPAALARAAATLLADGDMRARFAVAARERVARSFSMGRMARRLEQIYTDVAGTGRA